MEGHGRGVQSRALLSEGQMFEGRQELNAMDGVPETAVRAQPHPWRTQVDPDSIFAAVVTSTASDLLKLVAPPLAVKQLSITRIVNIMPNIVMSAQAPHSQAPPMRYVRKKRTFILRRYAASIALNPETDSAADAKALLMAKMAAMSQSALNTMEKLILSALMCSEEAASSMAYLNADKSPEQRRIDTLAYMRQVGIVNKNPAKFINLVEDAKRMLRRYGATASVIIVPTGLCQQISGTNSYNLYQDAGRKRDMGKGVPDYTRLANLPTIEHNDCGMDTRGNLQQLLRREILVGQWYPLVTGKVTSIYNAAVGDWRDLPMAARVGTANNSGMCIQNFIRLVTSSVIVVAAGSAGKGPGDTASVAFRFVTNMAGLDAGTMAGIDQVALHARACVWKPRNVVVINDVVVHDCSGGCDTTYINGTDVNARALAGLAGAGFRPNAVNYRTITSKGVNGLRGSCLYWPLDAAKVKDVPRVFDVTGQNEHGPTGDTAADERIAREMGLVVPVMPKANGYKFSQALMNSCVTLGSYRISNPDGSNMVQHDNEGPLSGLENNMHL